MESSDVSKAYEMCVLSLLVGIVRAEHFSEGILQKFLENGCIKMWIVRLKEIDDNVN